MTETKQVLERVLFVDDEQRVLDGLRRMLRPMRGEWDMQFVTSAEEALEIIKSEPVSVLITDMRMPGMTGRELLDEVSVHSPKTVRIALSGQCDAEHVYRSMNRAHQFLSKPCNSAHLRNTIAQACALRDLLDDEALKKAISELDHLPSMPAVYDELMRELESEDPSMPRVGEIIATDISMTARVLRLVNSAWFALKSTVTDTTQAALMVGIETLKALVLSAHVFSEVERGETIPLLNEVCDHSMQVAQLARQIAMAQEADAPTISCTFTAGMLHEVGLVVLASNNPDQIKEAVQISERDGIDIFTAERKVLGATHAEIGAYLLGLWGLPNPVLEAVAFQGDPQLCPVAGFSALTALHAADALVHESGRSRLVLPGIDGAYLTRLGMRRRLDMWRELM